MRLLLLLTAVAGLTLAACAPRSGYTRGGAAESGGIQTRAYDQAPATQAPTVSSKPLSETNSPDAIAARQAQARASGQPLPRSGYAAPAAPAAAATAAAATTAGEPAAPHAQVAAFEKGRKAAVRPGAALRSRPSSGSDAIQSLLMEAQVTLDSRVYNAEGYWWYVLAGAEDGWIAQSDLLQP
ncbi:MAG: SH3 domain-containing protein [Stagnimonas sp.]|nr:SH3 domain-containing protein [Stagnimonas sp.]